jgi:hypothetical protein
MRHKVEGDEPDNATAVKMWKGDVKPALACGRSLAKVVNFYQGDELPGGHACSKCFPPDPTLPKGAVVVVQFTNTQVILTGQGFYARCTSLNCTWVTDTVHARYQAERAARGHEDDEPALVTP